jgi:hypothetical protein
MIKFTDFNNVVDHPTTIALIYFFVSNKGFQNGSDDCFTVKNAVEKLISVSKLFYTRIKCTYKYDFNPYKPTGPKLERYTFLCLQTHTLKNELKEGVGQGRPLHKFRMNFKIIYLIRILWSAILNEICGNFSLTQ